MPVTSHEALFAVSDLRVSITGRALVDGLHIDVNPGEALALSGRSGSGKTTLLRTFAGLRDAEQGDILLRGRSPAGWGWPEFRRRVCLVSQQPALFEGTVEENLRRPFSYRVSGQEYSSGIALRLLESVGISVAFNGEEKNPLLLKALDLSVGERQRVCLVRALMIEPEVLLIDEPTSALDEGSAELVAEAIDQPRRDRGMAVILATHDRVFAERLETRRIDWGGLLPLEVSNA